MTRPDPTDGQRRATSNQRLIDSIVVRSESKLNHASATLS